MYYLSLGRIKTGSRVGPFDSDPWIDVAKVWQTEYPSVVIPYSNVKTEDQYTSGELTNIFVCEIVKSSLKGMADYVLRHTVRRMREQRQPVNLIFITGRNYVHDSTPAS